MRQAVILAGGKGTRLSEVSGGLPKPMVLMAGRPVLEYAIENLVKAGITDIHFFTGHESHVIEDHFKDGAKFGITPHFHVEDAPLGTAGAIVQALSELDDEFLVIYGDTIFNIDIEKMHVFHQMKNADVTVFLHPNDHPADSDIVEIDEQGMVTALHKYPHQSGKLLPNLVSAAFYIIKKEALSDWSTHTGPLDFTGDIFTALLAKKHSVYGYVSREYIKDMGTPERFKKVESDIASGKVAAGSLATAKPAIFIDRDGTLVKQDTDYVRLPEEIKLEEGAGEAIRLINDSDYLAILVTNQPVIARGEVSEEGLRQIHNKMEQDLGQSHAYLDAIYFCPHHPDKGFAGERPGYKIICNCRKPEAALITRAVGDLSIDLANSWFVGDTTTDMMTAKKAGVKSVLVKTGVGGNDNKYDANGDNVAANLLEAVRLILQ
jgi:D,D-heptose 1,7-bisphosphate phosphatase